MKARQKRKLKKCSRGWQHSGVDLCKISWLYSSHSNYVAVEYEMVPIPLFPSSCQYQSLYFLRKTLVLLNLYKVCFPRRTILHWQVISPITLNYFSVAVKTFDYFIIQYNFSTNVFTIPRLNCGGDEGYCLWFVFG